jgi:hypothetical protein
MSNVTIIYTDSLCPEGGVWAATQAFVTFIVTNVFAHAATLRAPAGTSPSQLGIFVTIVILHPILGGTLAFFVLGRYISRLKTGPWRWSLFLSGERLEHAIIGGAVAIMVPLRFAPLLSGRLETVKDYQKILMLDHNEFEIPRAELPFRVDRSFPRYVPFILPASTEIFHDFPYKTHRIPPSSSIISQLVGLFQLFSGIRQLYLAYDSSILQLGLTAPYLIVIPYLLMTCVNLIASVVSSSYTHVTLIPMKNDKIPKVNRVDILDGRVFALEEEPQPRNQRNDEFTFELLGSTFPLSD